MRAVIALLLLVLLALPIGCSKDTRPPIKEDTAANPNPEVMNIPKPDELPANQQP